MTGRAERNAALLRDFQAGLSEEQLGDRYHITPKHVRKLIGQLTSPCPVESGSFKQGWIDNPSSFARPGPPAPPPEFPGPIKFTCRDCGGTVSPRTWECGGCGVVFRSFLKAGSS